MYLRIVWSGVWLIHRLSTVICKKKVIPCVIQWFSSAENTYSCMTCIGHCRKRIQLPTNIASGFGKLFVYILLAGIIILEITISQSARQHLRTFDRLCYITALTSRLWLFVATQHLKEFYYVNSWMFDKPINAICVGFYDHSSVRYVSARFGSHQSRNKTDWTATAVSVRVEP